MLVKKILLKALLAGAIYFWLIALVHQFQIKLPMLYIYFNVPSLVYQDRIISFLTFGWGWYFFTAYQSLKRQQLLPLATLLVAGTGAIIGLMIIQFTSDFIQMDPAINPNWFALEMILLMIYFSFLIFGYSKVKRQHHDNC